jgi:hypothetical protein
MSFLRSVAWLILIVWLPNAERIGWQVKSGAALRLRFCRSHSFERKGNAPGCFNC